MKLINFINFFMFIILSECLLCFGEDPDFLTKKFEKLSEINNEWLKLTSVPEAARLLNYPPYRYHSNHYSSNALNISNVLDGQSDSVESNEGKCSDDLIQIITNLGSQWALQMLDSDGKLSSGMLRGGLIWPGHYAECNDVYAPLDENGHGDFHGQYCVSSWTLNAIEKYPNLPLTVGVCIPDSCSGEHLKTALLNISHILDRVPVLKKVKSYLSLNDITCKAKIRSWDAPSIVYLVVVSVFIILTILGSALALIEKRKSKYILERGLSCEAVHSHEGDAQVSGNIINSSIDSEDQHVKKSIDISVEKEASFSDKTALSPKDDIEATAFKFISKRDSVVKRILLCFSVFTNGEKILNVKNVDGQLLSIHGIRFLSLTWVILGHTYISSISIIGNRLDVLKDLDTFPFQVLLQSPFSVDSFFLLSGFLLGYLFLKEASKKNGKISWVYFYVHRIWRLTPAYMVVVFFYILIFKYLGSGPFWDDNHCDASRSSWWKYLLYINNFIPIHQMCLGWSWYLANDMQFYIISPLFLYPLWRWPVAGFSVLGLFLAATWTTTGVMSYKYDLIPMFVGATQTHDFTAYANKMWDSFDLIYDKPYCRIAPYIIGVILGYILHRTAGRKNFLTWWQQLLGWIIAAACSLSVVLGLYHVEMSRTVALFYNALCRSSFAIGLSWLIFACETGHGGFITNLLSWKFWIPLSRLTYSAYLVHPILIHGYYQSYQTALFFTEFIAVTNFMGFLVMSYGIAFMFSMVFESPLMNLEKLIIKIKSK